jgi:hypothetical protein
MFLYTHDINVMLIWDTLNREKLNPHSPIHTLSY